MYHCESEGTIVPSIDKPIQGHDNDHCDDESAKCNRKYQKNDWNLSSQWKIRLIISVLLVLATLSYRKLYNSNAFSIQYYQPPSSRNRSAWILTENLDSIRSFRNTIRRTQELEKRTTDPSKPVPQSHQQQRKNEIIDYLSTMEGGRDNMILLQWAPNGLLYRVSPVWNRDWFPKKGEHDSYEKTQPSTYGSVALLLNADILSYINWDIVPPVPVLLYTIPNRISNQSHFQVVPNPYDLYGFNAFCVWKIQYSVGQSDVTYEDYMNRTNQMVWRGQHHDKEDLARVALVSLSQDNAYESANNPDIPRWLDAADTLAEQDKAMDMEVMVGRYRYMIAIGGVSGTSWGGTRWKICTGGLTFKVDSFSHDWWHEYIKPWEHYIPVKADLSNLYELYQWAEQNPHDAYRIGQQGRTKCRETLEKEDSAERTKDILWNDLAPAPYQQIIDDATDLFNNHLHLLASPERDSEYNGGYTGNKFE